MTTANKSNMGRPNIDVDYDKLYELAQLHASHFELAAILGVSEDTITRRLDESSPSYDQTFADTYKAGRANSMAGLRRKQFDLMHQGKNESTQLTASIWLGKNILGQSDQITSNANINTQLGITVVHEYPELVGYDSQRELLTDYVKPEVIEGSITEAKE